MNQMTKDEDRLIIKIVKCSEDLEDLCWQYRQELRRLYPDSAYNQDGKFWEKEGAL